MSLEEQIKILQKVVETLQKENAALRHELQHLKEQLGLNSSNSSLPPSQTYSKRGLKSFKTKKKRGGQQGHKGMSRTLLDSSEVDTIHQVFPPETCDCGQTLVPTHSVRHQFYELPKLSLERVEYQLFRARCSCGKHYAPGLPEGVLPGMLGPRLLTWCNLLTSKCHVSRQKVCHLLQDTFGLKISAGTLSASERYLSEALAGPVLQLQEWLKSQSVLYVDETSWKEQAKKHWAWVATNKSATVFKIQPSRSQASLKMLIGQCFEGVVCSDRYSAYSAEKYRAACWAHLVRDFQRIKERAGPSEKIGESLLASAKKLFKHWHEDRDNRDSMLQKMVKVQGQVERQLEKGACLKGASRSANSKTAKTCQRILGVKQSLWTFLTRDVEPTNNRAERALRKLVLVRKIQYGSQSERGMLFMERIQSVIETCRQQKLDVWAFCQQALQAHFGDKNYPTLLPNT